MPTLGSRLRMLESRMAPPAEARRVYTVAGVGTDEEITEFLHAEGWAFDPDIDIVLHLTLFRPDFRDGRVHGPIPCDSTEATRLRLCHPGNPSWRLEAA